ncbi:predicted protein [Uncinocarpus reesii 1704]|uniref:N-acetyltransferase domain-containing protein n=1 Tax=Uncinocarpus reesii (strain UAMH 1704) TaxID=336963 RepID=C4JPF9_UNCRE|nr:uncharacterized protein UREG_04541 [Uncinocarpus reesii 1704]EEP79695.1 predicted protein [Uncinocarpus reesii 1704]
MRLQVQPLLDSDFPEMVPALWTSFENPFSGIIRAAAPLLNNDRATSLAASVEVQLAQHKRDQPESTWIKVVDEDAAGKLVGAARWMVYDRNPHNDGEADVADWWPEGSLGREYATKLFAQLDAPRAKMARRPHLFLNIAFTLPEYRGHGVGRMLVEWGTQKADSLGVECWLDASPHGQPVYEKQGFVYIMDQYLAPEMDEENMSVEEKKELKWLRETMEPIHVTCMWRPKRGRYVEGVTVKPWEQCLESRS